MFSHDPYVSQRAPSSFLPSESVWRSGDQMIFIPEKVVFPKRCIVTGVDDDVVFEKWTLSFVLPQYEWLKSIPGGDIVAGFFYTKTVDLQMPISAKYQQKQAARRRMGWIAFWIGIVLMCGLAMLATVNANVAAIGVLVGIVVSLFGGYMIALGGRDYFNSDNDSFTLQRIVAKKVHKEFLAALPPHDPGPLILPNLR